MKKYILFVFIIVILLSGCSYRELNELAIGKVMGIDYIDNAYHLSVQVLKLKKNEDNQSEEEVVLYEGHGDTIATAVRNISKEYPKDLYLGHLRIIVVGKEVISNDISKIFDYFLRSPESRNDASILINPNGTAKEILNPNNNKTKSFPDEEIMTMLETSMKKQGTTTKVSLEEFISMYLQKGITPITTGIILKDNNISLTSLIATKNNTSYKLNEKQSIAYNILNKNMYDMIITTIVKDEEIDLDVGIPKIEQNIEIKDNKITYDINIKLQAQIASINDKVNLEDKETQEYIQESIDKEIKEYMYSLIDFCKKEDIDVLGLKNMIYKKHYKKYDEYKDKNIYDIAQINIKTDVKVFRYGGLYRGTVGD